MHSLLFLLKFLFFRRFFSFVQREKAAKQNYAVCIVPVTVRTASPGSAV